MYMYTVIVGDTVSIKLLLWVFDLYRSRLVLSESLAHQSPRSPFRRAPSSIMSRTRSGSTSTVPFEQETQELLETAWSDIQRLREKEERKVGRESVGGVKGRVGRDRGRGGRGRGENVQGMK